MGRKDMEEYLRPLAIRENLSALNLRQTVYLPKFLNDKVLDMSISRQTHPSKIKRGLTSSCCEDAGGSGNAVNVLMVSELIDQLKVNNSEIY